MKIKIFDLFGKHPVSYDKGGKLYSLIRDQVCLGNSVELDFEGVELCATPFFNSGISVFIEKMTAGDLVKVISVKNMSENDRMLLNLSINNAIEHYNKINKGS